MGTLPTSRVYPLTLRTPSVAGPPDRMQQGTSGRTPLPRPPGRLQRRHSHRHASRHTAALAPVPDWGLVPHTGCPSPSGWGCPSTPPLRGGGGPNRVGHVGFDGLSQTGPKGQRERRPQPQQDVVTEVKAHLALWRTLDFQVSGGLGNGVRYGTTPWPRFVHRDKRRTLGDGRRQLP